jgi:hypothetical protein
MWESIAKVALVAFLVVAVLVIVVVFIRRLRAKGFPTNERQSLYGSAADGFMPPTPLPDWATQDDDEFPKR